jgi:hypothetical protein
MIQALRSATIFSLSADPPRAAQLEAGVHTAFDAAFLVGESLRQPCSVQKLSAAGATIQIADGSWEDAPLQLELANGQSIAGKIDWSADGEAGFVFDEPTDVIGILARTLANLPAERRNMPRVEISQLASIRCGNQVEQARARNISQGGVGIDTRLDLWTGDAVQLTFDGLRPLGGSVRWKREGHAGIAFDEELGWQTLMPWLRHAQRAQSRVATPASGTEAEGMIPDKHAIRLDAPACVREGVRWWNARVRGITAQLVELETRAVIAPGTQLWVSLPEIGGGPANVIEAAHNRILCEFRLPLRPRELGLVTGGQPR